MLTIAMLGSLYFMVWLIYEVVIILFGSTRMQCSFMGMGWGWPVIVPCFLLSSLIWLISYLLWRLKLSVEKMAVDVTNWINR